MVPVDKLTRRHLLKKLSVAASLVTLASARAADLPLIALDDPAATKVKYIEDASTAKGAAPGSNCANCALYQGKNGSKEGPCQIFPGKDVIAAGWCASWAPQI